MLAKDMHQILKIEFENCIFFSASESDTLCFHWSKVYNSFNKGIKTRKVGGIDMKIANTLLKMNNVFFSKCWQKVCTKLRKLSLKNTFFSFWGAHPPQTPPLHASAERCAGAPLWSLPLQQSWIPVCNLYHSC